MHEQLDLLAPPATSAQPATITKALLAAGWTGDPGLYVNRGVMWALKPDGNSQLTGPGGWTATFTADTPTAAVAAACLAAAEAQA